MSEKLIGGSEKQAESIDTSSESEKNLNRLREAAKNSPEKSVDDIEASLSKAKTEAVSGHEVTIGEKETTRHGDTPGLQRELKAESYKKTVKRIQSKLSKSDRALSKVIHQPTVDKASSAIAVTIARPSGILAGSFFALVGSASLLYFAKHYGFTYNYAFLFVLFVAGYVVGLLLEALLKLIRR